MGSFRYGLHYVDIDGYKTSWICTKKTKGCRARIVTLDTDVVVRFETTRYGNPVMVVGRYRYNRWSYSKAPQVRWTCVKNQMGCRATVTTLGILSDEPIYTLSRFGKPVIQVGKYRFNKWSGSKGLRARWPCVKVADKCKAALITIVPIFTVSRSGNPVIQVGEHRFRKSSSTGELVRWTCIKDNKGCRARLATYDGQIIKHNYDHRH
ncbi:unnamed protein product [Leptidea sinapis]|uniref:FLYWCH-type domain-containing protein n=1 Tax=Leptidea sinapis TaxID=189913 RepID=A0A5E4PZK1_9NEOP|nr:unnamed protein product [Leptidea sinapis]